jgi:hypothetical protein
MHGGVNAFFIDDLLNIAAPEKVMRRISPGNLASTLASLSTSCQSFSQECSKAHQKLPAVLRK